MTKKEFIKRFKTLQQVVNGSYADPYYLVKKIDHNGTVYPHYILDIDGVIQLLNMATPGKCKFEIQKIVNIDKNIES